MKMKEHATVFDPVTQEAKIAYLDGYLEDNNFAKIPLDYENFLRECDGMFFSGVEFYGIDDHDIEGAAFTFPSILSINEYYLENAFTDKAVIIGAQPEYLYLFKEADKKYSVVSTLDFYTAEQFDSFDDLLQFFN
jgi:hypothetical protein